MIDPYRSARAKMARARKVTDQLEQEITRFDGVSIAAFQVLANEIHWKLRIKDDPSEEYATAVGDIVHNLRSALDHAAVAAVVANGGSSKDVLFPTSPDPESLEKAIKSKNFHRASEKAVALLKDLKPYRGGGNSLRALHELDVIDKHKDLIKLSATVTQAAAMRIGGAYLEGNTFPFSTRFIIMVHSGKNAATLPEAPVRLRAHFGATEAFSAFTDQEIIPTVRSLAELVEGTVEAFARL